MFDRLLVITEPAAGVSWEEALTIYELAKAKGLNSVFLWTKDKSVTKLRPRRINLIVGERGDSQYAKFSPEGMVEACPKQGLQKENAVVQVYKKKEACVDEITGERLPPDLLPRAGNFAKAEKLWAKHHGETMRGDLQQWRLNERLLKATKQGAIKAVRALLTEGAQVDCTANLLDKRDKRKPRSDDWTPLMYAAKEGHVSILRHLLDSGASLSEYAVKSPVLARGLVVDHEKIAVDALFLATTHGRYDCVVALLDAGMESRVDDCLLLDCAASKQVRECARPRPVLTQS